MIALNFFIIFVIILNNNNNVNSAAVREIELNKNWTLINENGSLHVNDIEIPSGVYSALFKQSPDEILKSFNDVNLRWIAQDNWTYILEFDVRNLHEAPQDLAKDRNVNLTFYGIDTISTIKLNGQIIGHTDNMFVRYSYNIKNLLKTETQNKLEVQIKSPIYVANELAKKYNYTPPECPNSRYNGECHMNFLRKMQASFAWDWGLAAPSMGIWKTVTLEIHDLAIIRDVDVIVSKKNKNWEIIGRVFLETGINDVFYGNLTIFALDLLNDAIKISRLESNPVNGSNPIIEFTQEIPGEKVELWWPNGYGNQKLYHLHFTWVGWLKKGYDPRELTVSQKSIRIGFRTIELIQDDMPNGYSFYFRINGIPIFMKGTNYIPSHILPEKAQDQNRIENLLKSVKSSHMNMIRVWGGGFYESNFFYDMADYYGILIWQDMMFACAMYPIFPEYLNSVHEEVLQNVKRIAYHPSIAIFSGNNENEAALAKNWYDTKDEFDRFVSEYRHLYVGIIRHDMRIIEHSSRPNMLISSPTNGRKTEEENFISKDPQSPDYGDIHHYEYMKDGWDPSIYPIPRFVSEYGFQSYPSLTSWKRILGTNDSLESLMEHRQHFPFGNAPIILLNAKHFPTLIKEDADYYDGLIYFSQISQAMVTKTETEVYRSQRNSSQNTMGALYWQLNDVWIAPSWSSIDFNGNYKILHHWTEQFMAPVTVIAHLDRQNKNLLNIYIVRDTIDPNPRNYQIIFNIYLWSKIIPQRTEQFKYEDFMPNTAKIVQTINLNDVLKAPFTKTNCYFEFTLYERQEKLSKTYFFPEKLKNAIGIKNPQIEVEVLKNTWEKPLASISLAVNVQAPAIFVYLELKNMNITTYKFSKNGFIQVEPIESVHLEFNSDYKIEIKKEDIKVLTLNQFMVKQNDNYL